MLYDRPFYAPGMLLVPMMNLLFEMNLLRGNVVYFYTRLNLVYEANGHSHRIIIYSLLPFFNWPLQTVCSKRFHTFPVSHRNGSSVTFMNPGLQVKRHVVPTSPVHRCSNSPLLISSGQLGTVKWILKFT